MRTEITNIADVASIAIQNMGGIIFHPHVGVERTSRKSKGARNHNKGRALGVQWGSRDREARDAMARGFVAAMKEMRA